MKNNTIATIILMLASIAVNACPICEKQQPKFLRGITHGTGPQSNWDWVIISIVSIITLLTFIYSIKYLLYPKEKNSNHIKYSILQHQ